MKTKQAEEKINYSTFGLFLPLVVLLSACGQSEVESVRLPAELNPLQDYGLSVNSFRSTVYPIARQYCGSCHGGKQSPNFASRDPQAAHDSLMLGAKIDFTNIDRSPLVLRLTQQSHGCWTGNCQADADQIVAAIKNWGDMLGSERPADPITIRTNESLVPALLPTGTTNNQQNTTEMTWDLVLAMQPNRAPQRASITFQISRFDQYSYYIGEPVIRTSSNLFVRGIHFLINGIPARGATFRTVNEIVPIQLNDPDPIVGNVLIAEMNDGPGFDKFSIGFEELRVADLNAAERFQAVRDIFMSTENVGCFNCHSTPGAPPNELNFNVPAFPTFTTEAEFLNLTVRGQPFVVPQNPTASLLWIATSRNPNPGKPRMPRNQSSTGQDEVNARITEWIQKLGQP
jgi:hypothetical protein